MNLTERDRYPPLTPTLHSIVVYLIIKAASLWLPFLVMSLKLYKVNSEYLDKSWVVLATGVKDAAAQVVFESRDILSTLEKLMPEVIVNMDVKVKLLDVTVVEVSNE